MKCKFCQAELESNSSVCPECGKDNLTEANVPAKAAAAVLPLQIVALSLTCVVMLLLLAGLVHYGVTGSFLPNFGNTEPTVTPSTTPGTNNVAVPDVYTVYTADGVVTMDNATLLEAMGQVVATVGEHQLTNRQLQLYYWMAVMTYADSHSDLDLTADLSTVIHDAETGESVQEHCLTDALNTWQEVVLKAQAAAEEEYVLTEDMQAQLDGMEAQLEQQVYIYSTYYGLDISSVDELVQMSFGPGCNFATYFNYAEAFYFGELFWAEMALDIEVEDAQIQEYYAANAEMLKEDYGIDKYFGDLGDYRNILIKVEGTTVEDGDGNKTTTITDEDWEECRQKAQALYDGWLAAGGTEEGFIALIAENSDDELSVLYDGLYEDQCWGCLGNIDVRHILIFPEGATSSTITSQEWSEEAWAYAEAKAQEILDAYLAGEQTEEAFAELAKAHSQDGNAETGGIYYDVEYGYMVESFNDWCFDRSREPGNTGVVKTEYGYHVMYFVQADLEEDNWMFAEARQPGDNGIFKTDEGYELLYFVDSEPAWYRYSRYGVQEQLGDEMLAELIEANPYTVDYDKIALAAVE